MLPYMAVWFTVLSSTPDMNGVRCNDTNEGSTMDENKPKTLQPDVLMHKVSTSMLWGLTTYHVV